jgi:hypothetical protein
MRVADSQNPSTANTSSAEISPFTDIDFSNLDIPPTTIQPPNPIKAATTTTKSPYSNPYIMNAEKERRKDDTQELQEYWWLQMYIKLNRALGIILAVIVTLMLAVFVIFSIFGSINGLLNGEFAQSAGLLIGSIFFVIIYGFLLFIYLTIWFALGEFVAAILELTLNSRRFR